MRYGIRWFIPLLLLLLLATPALAQGSLTFTDERGNLDRNAVSNAAQPLVSRGARVAIYNVNGGSQDDFRQRLLNDGLARPDGQVRNELIGIYVSTGPNLVYIRFGDNWSRALNSRYQRIIDDQIVPNLRRGDYTAAFTSALGSLGSAIGAGGTSGGTGGGATVPGTAGGTGFLGPLLFCGAILAVVAGVFVWRARSKTQATAKAAATARQAFEEARSRAGVAITDFGRELAEAREKAKFDKVSYAPEQVQQLARLQGQAEEYFARAQERYKAIGDQLDQMKTPPGDSDYQQAAVAYDDVLKEIEAARPLLAQAQQMRAELDKVNAAVPGELDKAKQALAAVGEQINVVAEDFGQPDAVTGPAQRLVAQADALFQEGRGSEAINAARQAIAAVGELRAAIERYARIRQGIAAGRTAAQQVAIQGYKVAPGMAAFDNAAATLRQAAAALESGGVQAAAPLLDTAEAQLAEAVARGGGMPQLQQQNAARIPQLTEQLNQLDAYIAQGKTTFETVRGFAESAWSDIRGNGSEAEASAARARQAIQRATERNTMEVQDFYGAHQDLEVAAQEIARGRTLIDTVVQRLRDLENARNTARDEIALAESDINAGWEFVRAHDPDVGKQPEQALQRAQALVEQANAEMGKEQPDWLALVKLAREANRLADEALAGARSEVEEMNKLRAMVDNARQVAAGEVQKIVNFAKVHPEIIGPDEERNIQALQAELQAADAGLTAAGSQEEEARATQLRDTLDRYTRIENAAEALYQAIYGAFQQADALRRQVGEAVQQAQDAIAQAQRTLQANAGYVSSASPGVSMLQDAVAALRSIRAVTTEAEAQQAIATAEQARRAAEQAAAIFVNEAEVNRDRDAARRGPSSGDFLSGMILGSMLGGGHRGGWGGGGWGGGGGGGGGGGWGSGGGGGGSWGGGGGGGGGW